jgi:hypothetical protein
MPCIVLLPDDRGVIARTLALPEHGNRFVGKITDNPKPAIGMVQISGCPNQHGPMVIKPTDTGKRLLAGSGHLRERRWHQGRGGDGRSIAAAELTRPAN